MWNIVNASHFDQSIENISNLKYLHEIGPISVIVTLQLSAISSTNYIGTQNRIVTKHQGVQQS